MILNIYFETKNVLMSMVKNNVKVYEAIEDYTEAISSSSSVTFDNMKTIFALFFVFLSSASLLIVFSTYVAALFPVKIRRLLRMSKCKVSTKQPRRGWNAVRKQFNHPKIFLRRPPRNRRIVPFIRPTIKINDIEMSLARPGLLTRSILMESDWILRRAETL